LDKNLGASDESLPKQSAESTMTPTLPQLVQSAFEAGQRGDWPEAERLSRSALEANAESFEALYLLAIIAGRAGRPLEAVELLSRAVAVNPDSPDAHYNRGVALAEIGRYAEALQSYDRALALRPAYAEAHYNRGATLGELKRPADALASYERAIALKHDYAEAHHNRGIALTELKRPADALESYERAIALKPAYASAHNNAGVALMGLGRHADALLHYERAVALKPDFASAYDNRGIALAELDRAAEALDSHERAIALKPDYADAYYNRGNALRDLHRHQEAVASYEKALALKPDHAAAHWNLADCLLLLGDFARGWIEYEWRWKPGQQDGARNFPQPLWLGEQSLAGRTVLLHAELGLGDTLFFCRYAREVAALGANVILEVQPPLLTLLTNLEGVAQTLPSGATVPAFDYHCPLMSLPLAFRTDLTSIPSRVPYIRSDPGRRAAWDHKLGKRQKPRVALVWSGSARLRNDKRSMALGQMLPLLQGWAQWISLQKEVPETDAGLLASRPDIRHVGGDLRDFADTAAVIDVVDVVVTIDTSVANLAGAMGKPVCVLLPFDPHDWRWMLERADSPWYPTARLFRQPSAGDWTSVIASVAERLAREFRERI
jgi:tetratricopeptide (TPR) repeat protein